MNNTQAVTVTFEKVSTGVFDVYANGVKTKYEIINGSAGLSGRDTMNMYGISGGSQVRWVGTLQAAKKLVTVWVQARRAA